MSPVSTEFARQLIAKVTYMTIATVGADGQPWNTPVARTCDDQYNLYWASHKDSVHSRNIRSNNKVFIVVYDSTVPSKDAWGVYIQAEAFEINDEKQANEIAALFSPDDPYVPNTGKQYLGDYPRRIYKAVPHKVWMNDEAEINGNYIDIRKEVQLP